MNSTENIQTELDNQFYGQFREKSILVTGHTGFKGSWLTIWLDMLGARVNGLALDPQTSPNNYEVANVAGLIERDARIDIRNRIAVSEFVATVQPDVIFHLAAQPLVATGIEEPYTTFETNVMGTAAILEAVRQLQKPCAVVVVTSDKCYQSSSGNPGHTETDPLGGSEPYGASKASAEIVVNAYRETYFPNNNEHGISVASVRAGNVLGGGDWSPFRIVPDIVNCLQSNKPILLRSPFSIRPWQHVLVPLSGYLLLASRMLSTQERDFLAGAWNFGPPPFERISVQMVAEKAIEIWGSGTWQPIKNAYEAYESPRLELNIDKAINDLMWFPKWNFPTTMEYTINWYRDFFIRNRQKDMLERCLSDIEAFVTSPIPVQSH